MATFAVILPAAGKATRFQADAAPGLSLWDRPGDNKVFATLLDKPVWQWSMNPFLKRDDVVQRIIVVHPDMLDWFKEKFGPTLMVQEIEVVAGGAERADSVLNGLKRVRPDVEYVAVHDAARPILDPKSIDRVFAKAVETGAAILAQPVNATLKRVQAEAGQVKTGEGQIVETVPRAGLWGAQTPQVFRAELLRKAYKKSADRSAATDEAQLVELAGTPVHVVTGSPLNIKITLREDLEFAKFALESLRKPEAKKPAHPFGDEFD